MKRFALLTAAAFACTANAQTRLFGVDTSTDELYELDMVTGAKTLRGPVVSHLGTVGALTYDPVRDRILSSSTDLRQLGEMQDNGLGGQIGPYNIPNVVMHGLEWCPGDNSLYGAGTIGTTTNLYKINPLTGSATMVGTMANQIFGNLGWDSANNVMYATMITGGPSLYTVNLATGGLSFVANITGDVQNPSGLAFDQASNTMFMVDNQRDNLYRLNLTTGAATTIASLRGTESTNFISLVVVPVPEPASIAVLSMGACAMAWRRRRSRS